MKHKSIQPKWIVIVPILIFMFICTLNTCYEWYISNQQNAAMNVMQKVVDKYHYNAIELKPVTVNGKFLTIYSYDSTFSTNKTLSQNKRILRKDGHRIGKYDDIEVPYHYSISAQRSRGQWTVYVQEEPFGKAKKYQIK